jgi:hypothetical protein
MKDEDIQLQAVMGVEGLHDRFGSDHYKYNPAL